MCHLEIWAIHSFGQIYWDPNFMPRTLLGIRVGKMKEVMSFPSGAYNTVRRQIYEQTKTMLSDNSHNRSDTTMRLMEECSVCVCVRTQAWEGYMYVCVCVHAGERGAFREGLPEHISKQSPQLLVWLVLKFTDRGVTLHSLFTHCQVTFSQQSETWCIFERQST